MRLHLPPPEIFTFLRTRVPPSKIVISALGFFSAAEMAVKKPAAPPPITTIFFFPSTVLEYQVITAGESKESKNALLP